MTKSRVKFLQGFKVFIGLGSDQGFYDGNVYTKNILYLLNTSILPKPHRIPTLFMKDFVLEYILILNWKIERGGGQGVLEH